ncbi:MAG: hypothetical protein GXW94_19600 [Serratia liquefaciens]|nr:hypothetical protein [Serratia liquefaciens]
MTTPTSKSIPSNDVIDLKFNAEKIDEVVNSDAEKYVDRFGNERYTITGIANNAALLGKPYATLELAQADINSGKIANNATLLIVSDSIANAVDIYQNVNGVPTFTGRSIIDGNYVTELAALMNFVLTVIPKDLSNSIPGWAFSFINAEKTGLFGGFKTDGGWHLAGMPDAVQDRLKVIADTETTARIAGFHLVLLDVLKKSGFAISDDWGLWLAGLEKPVQDEINELKAGGGSALLRPYNGQLAVFKDAVSTTPVYAVNPVAYVSKLSVGGASLVYDEEGVTKTGTINLIEHTVFNVTPNNWTQRPIASFVNEVCFRLCVGQSLAVGGGNRVTEVDQNFLGQHFVFTAAGGDRGAGGTGTAEGPVTAAALNVFKDAESIGDFRENCIVPGGQRFQSDLVNLYGYSKFKVPAIVSRIDARSGTPYSGLKKGTQAYTDGLTSFTTFVELTLAQGKIPKSHSIITVHGENDSALVTALGQYKGYLNEWITDIQTDQLAILADHGVTQDDKAIAYVDQMGGIGKTASNRGDWIAYDQLAISNERADVVCTGPAYHLNRKYPLDNTAGQVHLLGVGYAIKGEYQGQAEAFMYKERLAGTNKKWKSVQPISMVKNGLVVDVTFSSPLGLPLKPNTKFGTAPNLGADLENGSANIVSAVQQSDFVFRFTLSAEPAAGEYLRFGFSATDSHYPLVCISDTSARISKSDPTFVMENFCSLSHIAIN